jgi:hypothetical protein
MGSIAMDKAGDIALGYSISSSSMSPSIRYTGRFPGDPLNQMESEIDILSGAGVSAGSQTGSFRWGDYSAMSIDPVDDCTFWYTTEYQPTNGSAWSTRIASFSFPSCAAGPPALTVTPAGTGSGTVTSTPTGIDCGTQCSSTFVAGTSVTLSANAAGSSGFDGWSGPCSGTGTCTFAITSAQSVGASFNLPDFAVTAGPPATATVVAGGQATFGIGIAGLGGFSSAVTLGCSAPTTQGVNCTLASASVQPGSSVNLTVKTTGPSAGLIGLPGTAHSNRLLALWIYFPVLGLAAIGWVGVRSKKRGLACLLLCVLASGLLGLQMACGGGSSSPKNTGTPAGVYTVNINATSGTTQHSASVSVTVQ